MGSKAGERETLRPGQRVERLREAADARDWDLLGSLCHPDARLVLRMTEGTALALDDALAVLRADAEAGAYEPTHYYIDDVDESAAIAVGSVMGPHDQKPKHLCWLLTFRDGLLYRQTLHETSNEAEELYGKLGLELGITSGPEDEPR